MVSLPSATHQLSDRIPRMLALRNGPALRRLLARHNFADVAEVMETMPPDDLVACFQLLGVGQAAQVLLSLSPEKQNECLTALPPTISSQILRYMASDDAVDILQELDTQHSQKILSHMPFDTDTRRIHHLLMEAPDTAAGIMSTDFLQTRVEGTAEDALTLVKLAEEKDFVYYCYVVDSNHKLLGTVSLKQLIRAKPDTPLHEIAHFDIKSVAANDDQEAVVNCFRKYYNLLALPVVDDQQILQGIITLDDVIDIIDEETSEDFYLSSGINVDSADEKNLLSGPAWKAVRARLPWLSITLCGQFFVSCIIAYYQHTVAAAVIAYSFVPMLSGLSGNMGTQSETIAVRGLALRQITDENVKSTLYRELRVALMTGSILASGLSMISFILYRHWELSLLLFCAAILAVCIAASLGLIIPYSFKKHFKQDPAGVGGPMITTLLDLINYSLFLYMVTLLIDRMI